MKVRDNHQLYHVVTPVGETLQVCTPRVDMPAMLMIGASVSFFRSVRHARSYIVRTGKWAKAENFPWAHEVAKWRVLPVVLKMGRALK